MLFYDCCVFKNIDLTEISLGLETFPVNYCTGSMTFQSSVINKGTQSKSVANVAFPFSFNSSSNVNEPLTCPAHNKKKMKGNC